MGTARRIDHAVGKRISVNIRCEQGNGADSVFNNRQCAIGGHRRVINRTHDDGDGRGIGNGSFRVSGPVRHRRGAVPVLDWGEGQLIPINASCAVSRVRCTDDAPCMAIPLKV